ncbi:hypothetical protein [Planktothrix agardhii]|nr:hypothetical protein [Planktothrix agardhii]
MSNTENITLNPTLIALQNLMMLLPNCDRQRGDVLGIWNKHQKL